jgi:hypothetical protein
LQNRTPDQRLPSGGTVSRSLMVAARPVTCTGGQNYAFSREADGEDEVRRTVQEQVKAAAFFRRPAEQSLRPHGRPPGQARLRAERVHVRAGNPPAAPHSARSPHHELHRSSGQLHREQAARGSNDFASASVTSASSWPTTRVTRCVKRSRSERWKSCRSPGKTSSTVGIESEPTCTIERSPLHHAANRWQVDRPKHRHFEAGAGRVWRLLSDDQNCRAS